ncbi:MAG: hypothetical protein H6595_09975 [Flavobacteriales bacterium]|nr:hypothetical protein [Flavobacteriales bacterium]
MDEQQPNNDQPLSGKDQIELKKLELWKRALSKVELYFQFKMAELQEHDVPVSKRTLTGLFWMTLVIVIAVSLLVSFGKITESSFTFVMGTVLGLIVAMGKSFFGTEE